MLKFLEKGGNEVFIEFLNENNSEEIILLGLKGVNNIFYTGSDMFSVNDSNLFVTKFDEKNFGNKLISLENHKNSQISKKASKIINTYYLDY